MKAKMAAEAYAIRRQTMGMIAQSVAAGMSNKNDFRGFMNSLELDRSRLNIINDNREMMGMPQYMKEE